MKKIILIKSLVMGMQSHTKRMLDSFEHSWTENHKNTAIIQRDLIASPLPIMDEDIFSAYYSVPEQQQSEKQKEALAISDKLIEELKISELIVIAAPMYNLSIPSQLKNYFDLIIRAGLTFNYVNNERIGLLKNKKALILTSQGGLKNANKSDYFVDYLRDILSFVGIEHTNFIGVEGIAMDTSRIELEHINAETQMKNFINNY
ncbi:NAD(P)H-dependent oxidoreductase [Providencia rettgeri]|nr:NAD(P)H-dependent oxidoreductase [Providencia rettgeri]